MLEDVLATYLDSSAHGADQIGHDGRHRYTSTEASQRVRYTGRFDFFASVRNGNEDTFGGHVEDG